LEVNRHLAETFNLPREAFVGQNIGFLNSSSEFNTFVRQFFADDTIQDAFREVSAKVNGIERKYLIVAQKYDHNKAAFTIGIDITERQQAEERLRQAEAKYRNIFENAVEGIFQTTPEGYFISANPALARIYGYDSPEDLIINLGSIGDNLYVEPGTRAEFIRRLNQYGSVVGFEAQVYRRDGTLTWISENARTVCDEEGNLLFYEGTVEDIAERKEAQEALQRANEQLETRVEERTAALRDSNRQLLIEVSERQKVEAELRALFAAMTDVIAVFDAQGRYLKIVSTNSELLYNPSTERIGKTVYEVLPSSQAKLFVSHIQRALNTGQTVNLEYNLPVTPNGKDAPMQEMWYAANVSPMPDNCAIWVARDITERKYAEKALEKAEEKYRSIFENAAEGIFQIAPDGRHISANPALINMYGYLSLRDLIGSLPNVNEQLYVNRERRQEFLRLLERDELVSNFESQIYRKDGSIIWISENTRVVRDEVGKLLYYEGTATDITKRKEAEEALREEQARSERLLLNILPKTIAEQLKHYEGSLAERFDEATV
ncbi:MAG: PAS domain S-box protein, partial [Spirulinaceae cyanobacterium]